jgi:hypothetical protein
MQSVLYTIITNFEKNIEIDFQYSSAKILTFINTENKKQLSITNQFEIDDSESINVVKDRSDYVNLIILDFLSYFTNTPLTLQEFYKSIAICDSLKKTDKNYFIVNGENIVSDVNGLFRYFEFSSFSEKEEIIKKFRLKRYDLIESNSKTN